MNTKILKLIKDKLDQQDLIFAQKTGIDNYLNGIYSDLILLAENNSNVQVTAHILLEKSPAFAQDSEEYLLQILYRLENRKRQFAEVIDILHSGSTQDPN
jgi:hypothetical protein